MAGKITWKKGRVITLTKYDQKTASETVILVNIREKKYSSRYEWIRKPEVEQDEKFDSAWKDIQVDSIVRVYFVDEKFSHITVLKNPAKNESGNA